MLRASRLNRRRAARFCLIAIVLIIFAVAFPRPTSDRDRRYRQEMVAQKAITTIFTAETQYHSQFGRYATSLTQLGPPASGAAGPNGADLIDRDLGSGEKGGFKFVLQQTASGYALSVAPAAFGTSGMHTFYSDQSMSIHVHSGQEPATVNDPLLGETQQHQQQEAPQQQAPAPAAP